MRKKSKGGNVMSITRKGSVLMVLLMGCVLPAMVFASVGNTTMTGTTGSIVVPSAVPVSTPENPAVTTGYSALYNTTDGFSHIPFLQIAFMDDFEAALAADIGPDVDLIFNGKWRFVQTQATDFALIVNGQALGLDTSVSWAGRVGFAGTFESRLLDYPTVTSIYLGYTFDTPLDTDIDFAMSFETPVFSDELGKMLSLVIDFGNVGYSVAPSGGDAADRGLLNFGLRLLPIEFIKDTYIMADVRILDFFDSSGRAASLGINISFRP